MAYTAPATPVLLTDVGVLYWAPLGSTLPTPVSTASAFSDTWPVAWIPLGMTASGSSWSYSLSVSPIEAAEVYDPIQYKTDGRTASMTATLLSFTAYNLARALNTAPTTVSGTGVTLITKVSPPAIGSEIRCMIGFESADSTVRAVGYQSINSGDIAVALQKGANPAGIPFTFNFEKPSGATQPMDWWVAGATRTGT